MVFFRRNKKTKDAAHLLFTEIVIQARNPHFYAKWGVADNIDGRFDLIILHLSLVINRLEAEGKEKKITLLIRYLQEVFFDNMDMSLRELGVGDMSVGKKVKVMAEACYGRMAAYRKAINSDKKRDAVQGALIRNIYREQLQDDGSIMLFTSYVMCQMDYLARQGCEDLMSGKLIFEEVKE